MTKYLFYNGYECSDDYDTLDDCIKDATEMAKSEGVNEVSVYSYDTKDFPNGEVGIDDCSYECFISKNETL